MCGRFTLTVHRIEDVAAAVGAYLDEALIADYRPRYNIAPGDDHWLLRSKLGRRELVPAGWGLVNHWATDPKVGYKHINARAETLSERRAYREAFRSRRCAIPADGFYEWRGPKKAREPVRYHDPGGGLVWFAGLYEGWTNPETGELRRTFTIVTTAANELVAQVHDRMPAILPAERLDDWLAGDDPGRLLAPAPATVLAASPASPRLNTAEHDDPDLLDPADPRAKRQLKLFG